MALITGLLLLVVVTVIAVTMFRSFGSEQQIAGNVREKQRAFNAAVSAQQYGEWWLVNGTVPSSATVPLSSTRAPARSAATRSISPAHHGPWASSIAVLANPDHNIRDE